MSAQKATTSEVFCIQAAECSSFCCYFASGTHFLKLHTLKLQLHM
jgi:hypothetical protein